MLHLKMACTTLKVPDDHEMMHAHGFSFWIGNTVFKFSKIYKGFIKGQVNKNITTKPSGSSVCLIVPLDREKCKYLSIIYCILSIFLKPHAQRKKDGIPFPVLVLLLLYNILLLINHHIGNSTIKHLSRSMSDKRDLTETFHQKISSHYKFIASAF